MTKLDAGSVAKLLVELGRRTALIGGDSYFRSRAYVRAAERIAALAEPLGKIIEEGRLQEIPGIGAVIADVVTSLHNTGTH
ncbi:MAG: DNA polymerase/3'-5' exonuclease PolX, partial [Alphaproteobacteria bacterium]|nr:DNA polymerase/3'-5' exonuclease PolX [Alphaproteobacteria bacterium]